MTKSRWFGDKWILALGVNDTLAADTYGPDGVGFLPSAVAYAACKQ